MAATLLMLVAEGAAVTLLAAALTAALVLALAVLINPAEPLGAEGTARTARILALLHTHPRKTQPHDPNDYHLQNADPAAGTSHTPIPPPGSPCPLPPVGAEYLDYDLYTLLDDLRDPFPPAGGEESAVAPGAHATL